MFFLDSSVVIETYKGNKEANKIFEVLEEVDTSIYINIIVFSEATYILSFKREVLSLKETFEIFESFESLVITQEVEKVAQTYMLTYHLKPNDALILATCKYYGVKCLVSLDSDFEDPCEQEDIKLINTAEKLKKILNP